MRSGRQGSGAGPPRRLLRLWEPPSAPFIIVKAGHGATSKENPAGGRGELSRTREPLGMQFFFWSETVMHRDFFCDTNRLRLLLQDELPPPAQAELVGHLDDCEQCQQALEKLASDKGWWHELRQIDGFGKRKAQVVPPSAAET